MTRHKEDCREALAAFKRKRLEALVVFACVMVFLFILCII